MYIIYHIAILVLSNTLKIVFSVGLSALDLPVGMQIDLKNVDTYRQSFNWQMA